MPTYGCYAESHPQTFYTQDPQRFAQHVFDHHKLVLNLDVRNKDAIKTAAHEDKVAEIHG